MFPQEVNVYLTEAKKSWIGVLLSQDLGGSLWSTAEKLLNVPLEPLVASLGLVSAAFCIFQAQLQSGHTAVISLQSRLELCHFGSQLRVLLLQSAKHTNRIL